MDRISETVWLHDVRLSYPHLDKPVSSASNPSSTPKYEATFLIAPQNPDYKPLQQAIWNVMLRVYGDRNAAMAAFQNPRVNPLRAGESKNKIPEGYHGMYFIKASSQYAPDLVDPSGKYCLTDPAAIHNYFVPGYYVDAVIEIYPYSFQNIQSGFSARLQSVQPRRPAEAFVGSGRPALSEYTDYSAAFAMSGGDAYAAPGYPAAQPAPAPVQQQQMSPTQALDMAVAANERAMRAAQQQQTQQGYQTQAPAQSYQQPDPRNFAVPGQQQGFQDDPMPF